MPATNRFAIKNYHDTDKVYEKLRRLIQLPIYTLKAQAYKNYLEYYELKCRKSKALLNEALEVIPGGVQHNLAFNHPFPIAFTQANGHTLTDLDGNQYIDFLQAGGPTVLGSNPNKIKQKVIELLNECGPVTGLFHEYEYLLSKKVCELIPSVEKLRMLGSGTEAAMAAIRVARLATKKKNVIKMGGAYHGWSDQLCYSIRLPGTKSIEAKGVPSNCFKYIQEFYPNDIQSLEKRLKKNRLFGGTAAVIMEPIGPESGTRPLSKAFNQQVKALCDKYKTLLIFDEVVTAFRIGMSGAQGYFDVKPDLTIFGKVIGGGYPCAGALGGTNECMRFLSSGLGGGKTKKALVGGTLAANPLTACAGYYTLCELEKTNACEVAGRAGDYLTAGLNQLITKYQLPFVAFNQGSIVHLETVGTLQFDIPWSKPWRIPSLIKEVHRRKEAMEHMGCAYMAEGLVTLAGSRLYTNAQQNQDVLDNALSRFENVFANIEHPKE